MSQTLLIYAYIFTGLVLVSTFLKIYLKASGKYDDTPRSVQIEELIFIPFTLLGCAAIFGALYETAIFSAFFWQVYVALSLLHMLLMFRMPKMAWLRKELSTKSFVVLNAVGLISGLPFFFLLVRYAFLDFPLS